MKSLYEELRIYYMPWIVAAAAIAVILWQQQTTLELIERINESYLERLSAVAVALDQVNTTLQTDGYTLPPFGAPETGAQVSQ